MKRGLFITFEGIDGSGKSTQVGLLKSKICKTNHACYTTLEPTDGPIGSLLRLVLSGRIKMDERSIAALFAADRLDHINNDISGIRDKLLKGTSVICDRYLLSSYAYQSVRTPLDWVMNLNSEAERLVNVDCTVFIDISPDVAIKRIALNRGNRDLFETKDRLVAVREKYLELIDMYKSERNILIVDGEASVEEISDTIWEHVSTLLD
jgi:dTMP kinase